MFCYLDEVNICAQKWTIFILDHLNLFYKRISLLKKQKTNKKTNIQTLIFSSENTVQQNTELYILKKNIYIEIFDLIIIIHLPCTMEGPWIKTSTAKT